nr:promoter nifLA [Klebsiella pneumoniae]
MANIGIFFATDTGKTRKIAKMIHKQLGELADAPLNMTLNMMLDNAVPEAIAGALTQQHPGLFFTMVEQASVAISLTDARAN